MTFSVEQPLMYCGALSAAMSTCLYLFVSTERKIGALRRKVEDRNKDVASIETRLGEWAGRTKEVEDAVSSLSVARQRQVPANGVNTQQRTKVLRMAKKGDGAEQIATELGIPKNEVDLLLKVQRAVVRTF
ncbi:MAG: hypothetical protein HYX27_25895 [Acidobacteria bacterium]|nr:hypothetical protein [Acidobacteriota bacterium]